MTSVFVLVLLAVVATVLVIINKRRSIDPAVRLRDKFSDEDVWNHFRSVSSLERADVIEVWHELANCLQIDPELLRPGDEFGKTVGRGASLLTPELDAVSDWAAHRAKISGAKVDLSEVGTVHQLILALSK